MVLSLADVLSMSPNTNRVNELRTKCVLIIASLELSSISMAPHWVDIMHVISCTNFRASIFFDIDDTISETIACVHECGSKEDNVRNINVSDVNASANMLDISCARYCSTIGSFDMITEQTSALSNIYMILKKKYNLAETRLYLSYIVFPYHISWAGSNRV